MTKDKGKSTGKKAPAKKTANKPPAKKATSEKQTDAPKVAAEKCTASPVCLITKFKENPIFIIAFITLLIVVVAYLVAGDKMAGTYDAEVADEMRFFTSFKDRINDVSAITMVSRGQTFNVEKIEGQWLLPDRHTYPVGIDKVRDIVINASELEILEKKTNDPEKLGILGLDDPSEEGSESVQITLFDSTGAKMADFIAGNRRKSGGRTFYARNVDESQAYLVKGEGWLRIDLSPNHWLNSEIFKLDKDRIEKVSFDFVDKKSKDYSVARSHAGARRFRVDGLGKREIISDNDVTEAAFSLSTLTLSGVAPKDFITFEDGKTDINTYKAFDGLEMVVHSTTDKDGDRWIKLEAKADGAGIKPQTRDEAATINESVEKWVYLLTEESAKLITSKFEELTKPSDDK